MANPSSSHPCAPDALRRTPLRNFRRIFPKRLALWAALLGLMSAPLAGIAAGDPKRGNDVFQQYCSGCHGPEGRGSKKSGFMPRPKNLTMKGYTELLPDEYLFGVIAKGGQSVNKSEYMPAFEGAISEEDIDNVIAFIRTLVLH
jgi:mono/diheme cytochrome c family protein